ncbi:ferritin-like domain-containing protein (plasmid) [Nostoc sp. UHCC 0302]|uniref:ferritin-like domain-containing protein n=1 Tax=Nostoc sp. UHCC 0302 TaxID=3134896 RepID=UPI00311CCBED
MNLLTYIMHLAGTGAATYYISTQIRDSKTRPNVLAGLQLSEASSVPFLSLLSERAAKEGNTWLAEKLAKHALDETKHSRIFAHALKQMNKQAVEDQPHLEAESTSKQKPSPFFLAYFDGYTLEELKPTVINWDVFLGSTYILELDSSKDYKTMAKVLPENELSTRNLKKGLLSIAEDEASHAAYLYEGMMQRMSINQVQKLVDDWRIRKVNSIFRMATSVFQNDNNARSISQDIEIIKNT